MVVGSQIRQRVWMENLLDDSETYWVLQKTNKKLLSMHLGRFEQAIMNDDFESLEREVYFNP